jgi:hypothetical protein
VVEEVHPADVLTVNDGNGVGAAQSNEKRDGARLNDLETQKLLIEAARESKVAALQRAVRKEVELSAGTGLPRRTGATGSPIDDMRISTLCASSQISELIVAQRRNRISRRPNRQTPAACRRN